jgi:DNA segregation ATPase FtsK/SpoIIIE-like protein
MVAQGEQGQLRRYHFRARLAFLMLVGLALLVVHAMANFSGWLIAPDIVVIAVLGWFVWEERDAVRFLLAWRSAVIGAGLGHTYQTTNRKGEKIDKIARPQVRRLWVGPSVVRVHVLPVAGQAVKLEQAVENLAGLLGMSRAVIAERRPGLRSMRYVLDFHRPAGQLATQRVELPQQRRAAVEDGETIMREVPKPLLGLPVPATVAAEGVGSIDQETGRRIGQRMTRQWYLGSEYRNGSNYAPVEIEYRPDIASRTPTGEMLRWRRTADLDGAPLPDSIPPQCRPGMHGPDHELYNGVGCSAFNRLPEDERHRVYRGLNDAMHLPCSECPHVPKEPIAAESVPVPVLSDVTDWRDFLRAVPVGKRADGGIWTIPLYDTQGVLFAGKSRAGKSGVFWALNIGLAPALIAGVVEIRAIDPKAVELWHGYQERGQNGFFTEYADNPAAIVELLEQAVEDMNQRKMHIRRARERKYTPSVETPLVLIEIDELVMVQGKNAPDPKLAKQAEKAIVTLLTQGGGFGFIVVGGIQDPRVENLGMRDLFQVTVALRLENEHAQMVLSRAAVKEGGANTEAIAMSEQGTGYVMDTNQSGSQAMKVRAFWASDEDVYAWNGYLVEARGLEASERYEAAQKAAEQTRAAAIDQETPEEDGGGEVIELRPPQTA